jgi:hypothetical protein
MKWLALALALLIAAPAWADEDFKVFVPAQATQTTTPAAIDCYPLVVGGGTATHCVPGNLLPFTVSVSLTASQINHLFSAPLTLVAAPGTGKMLQPLYIVFAYHAATISFNSSSQIHTRITFGPAGQEMVDDQGVFMPDVSSVTVDQANNQDASPTTNFENLPFTLYSNTDLVNFGEITASNLTVGNAGLGYAPGDTGTISIAIDNTATYVIDTVGAGGAVLTYHLSLAGSGYPVQSAVGTTVSTGAGDGNFQIDITAITPGDGIGSVSVTYKVLTLP